MNFKGLRIVVFESPIDCFENAKAKEVFCDLVQLKLDVYSALYRNGVVPVGDADYVGIHSVLCKEEGDGAPKNNLV